MILSKITGFPPLKEKKNMTGAPAKIGPKFQSNISKKYLKNTTLWDGHGMT